MIRVVIDGESFRKGVTIVDGLIIFLCQISYLEGIIRSHESNIVDIESDSVRLTQVSYRNAS